MDPLATHLGAADKASMFDALERAATRVGLALFVVHVDAAPPVVIYASDLLVELVGRPAAELVNRPPWELVVPEQHDRVRDIIASRGPGAEPLTMEVRVERPGGAHRDIEVGIARIATPRAELAVCYFRDATGEHQALAALRRSEAGFRSLIERAPDGVVIIQQGRIVLANPAAVRMFGVTDFDAVRDRLISDFLPADDAARAMARIAQISAGIEQGSSDYHLVKNGLVVEVHSVPYEYNGKPANLAFVRDATERRRMQEQLVRSDRLAALGTMAATVAHEINNPLTYLQLNLEQLEIEAAEEPDPARAAMLREHLANALHGVHRVARIVRDLRAYSRNNIDEVARSVDVVSVVERALQMVDHDLRHRARLVRNYASQPAVVDAIEGRLEQVIVNLLVNALQALDGADPSKEAITVAIDVDRHHVTIAVSDTGPGIAEPERIFEPFFTTKPVGEGTGLGLSVCKQIVEGIGGRIEVKSALGHGTTISIVLPAGGALPRMHPTLIPQEAPAARFRVLVIDDEPHVRGAMQALLASRHDVESVGDGESALGLLQHTRYDVILCDLMMPRMNGRDVYEQISHRWPGLERRVVFVTGGAFLPALEGFLESVDNLKLSKPFSVDNVLAIIRDAHQRS